MYFQFLHKIENEHHVKIGWLQKDRVQIIKFTKTSIAQAASMKTQMLKRKTLAVLRDISSEKTIKLMSLNRRLVAKIHHSTNQ